MATVLGSLLVSLGLDSSQFRKGSDRALGQMRRTERGFEQSGRGMQRSMGQLRSNLSSAATAVKGALAGMVAGLAADTFIRAAQAGLEYAGSLKEVAQQVGVSVTALQEYRYAAGTAGIATAEMDGALTQLNRRMGQAAAGTGSQAEAFARYGIAIRGASGEMLRAEDILPQIAEKYRALGSDAERAAMLTELFGRSGQRLAPLLAEGAAGIARLRQNARDLGIVMDEAMIDKADEASQKFENLRNVLQVRMAVAVTDNVDGLTALADAFLKVITFAAQAANAIRRFAADVDYRFARLAQTLPEWFIGRQGAADARALEMDARRRIGAMNLADAEANGLTAPIRGSGRRAAPPPRTGRLPMLPGPAAPAPVQIPFAPARDPRLRNLRFLTDDVSDPAMNARTVEAVAETVGTLREEAENLGLTLRTSTNPAIQSMLDQMFPAQARYREWQANIRLLDEALDRNEISITDHAAAIRALRDEWGTGGEGRPDWLGLGGLLPDADPLDIDPETIGADLLREWGYVRDGLGAANVRIVESFAEMAQGALAEVDRFVRGIRGGNVLDIVSGLLGALDKIGGLVGGFNLGPLKFGGARAMGGPVSAGKSYLVGERGPELVTFGRSGMVTPNHRMGGGNITVYVNAQDAVLADTVRGWVADGIRQATGQGAALGSQLAQAAMARSQSRVPA